MGRLIGGCQIFPHYVPWTPSTQSRLMLRAAAALGRNLMRFMQRFTMFLRSQWLGITWKYGARLA
jgi:hypothetical protein